MIHEQGRVVSVDAEGIWVETTKSSACASCAARNGCGQKLLNSAGAGKAFVFQVTNPSQLQVNSEDQVIVGIEESAFLKATLFVYLIPLLGLFIGAAIPALAGIAELYVIISAFLCMFLGFAVVKYGSLPLFQSYKYQPTLMRVI